MAAAQLNTVIKAKSDYMLKRLDEKIAEAKQKAPPPAPAAAAVPKPVPATPPAASAVVKKPAAPSIAAAKKPAGKPSTSTTKGWAAHTRPDEAGAPPAVAMREPEPLPGLPLRRKKATRSTRSET